MKKYLVGILLIAASASNSIAQEYRIITTIESIVPMGIGRSRILDHKTSEDYKPLTTERTDGRKSEQSDVKRDNIRIENFEETKLLNFYSGAGINFQNISSNDAVVSSKLSNMAQEGWELVFVTSGVESDSGQTDGNGIFITRFVFKRSAVQAKQY
jgi:hypothetical protein